MTSLSIFYILIGALILVAALVVIALVLKKHLSKDSVEFDPRVIARPEGNHHITLGNEDFLEDIEDYIDNQIRGFAHESKHKRKKHIR